MKKFRNRLTVIFILIISLSNIAAGIFIISMLRDSQIRAQEEALLEQLRLYLATVSWEDTSSGSVGGQMFSSEALRIAAKIGSRVTFFDNAGRVLGDSVLVPPFDEEFAGIVRPEIGQAMNGGSGMDVRKAKDGDGSVMYVAVPVDFGMSAGVGFVRFGASLNHLDAETMRFIIYLAVGLFAMLLATAGISYRISKGLTDPLEKITRVANQISHSNYKSRVNIKNQDEIGMLGRAINTMADSLQVQMKQIQEDENRLKSVLETMISGVIMIDQDGTIVLMNRSAEELLGIVPQDLLGKRYTALKAQFEFTKMIGDCLSRKEHVRDELVFYYPKEHTLEVNLVPMTNAAGNWVGIVIVLHDITAIRRLERMRSEFVANVSHELKTPIAAVKGFTETLLGGAMNDPETAKAFLHIINDESERLNRLIGDILDLSKIESKRVLLDYSAIEMKPFVERVAEMMRSEANKKLIQLDTDIPDGLYLEADEDRVRQILINLLSNAISYTLDGGNVRIAARPTTGGKMPSDEGIPDEYDGVRIIVEDTGIGIPRKDLPRIFERFYRVDKARTRASGGTGLGLSIVKHLVELHKGKIKVESTVGVGTRFIIDLPVLQ